MDARSELQDYIKNMPEEAVQKLLEAAEEMIRAEGGRIERCPY